MSSIVEIRQEVAAQQRKIATLESAKASASSRIATLEIERQALAIPARVDKDKAAQVRLDEVCLQIEAAQRDMRHDEAAIAALHGEQAHLESQLEHMQQQERARARREELRKAVIVARERVHVNIALLRQLLDGLKTSAEDIRRLNATLNEFGIPPLGQNYSVAINLLISDLERGHAGMRQTSVIGRMEPMASSLAALESRVEAEENLKVGL